MSVLPLSVIRNVREKRRLDSEYYSQDVLRAEQRVAVRAHVFLKQLCRSFRKGIFDIAAESYVEHGVPLVRICDLKEGLIDPPEVFIDPERHAQEQKTALVYGDLILSKTAYAAASMVSLAECNASQDTIAVRLAGDNQLARAGFVAAYLNGSLGKPLLEREFQGNVQRHLGLRDAELIPVPVLGAAVVQDIDGNFRLAAEQLRLAVSYLDQAQLILTRAIAIPAQVPAPLTYTCASNEALAAGRLDAQFYSPQVTALRAHLAAAGLTIRDVAPPRRTKFRAAAARIDYIEISDIGEDGTAQATPMDGRDAPSRATWVVGARDVLTSLVRPNRGLTAIVQPHQQGAIASSGFVVLQPQGVAPELLLTYLKLPAIRGLLDLYTSASMYPAISERDLLAIPFAPVPAEVEADITREVQAAFSARRRARALLDGAVRAVEIAVEDSEAAALVHLEAVEAGLGQC